MSSLPDTELISVSNTPDFKFATSTFDKELPVPSASNVLFVRVSVLDAVMPVLEFVMVKVSPDTAVVMPVPPATLNVSFCDTSVPEESSPTNVMPAASPSDA